jgi:hypothetical protein
VAANRSDDTPPGSEEAKRKAAQRAQEAREGRGRYDRRGGVPVDIVQQDTIQVPQPHPLPPPPIVHRAPTNPVFPRARTQPIEAVPELLEVEDSMVHHLEAIPDPELRDQAQAAYQRRRLRVTSSPPPFFKLSPETRRWAIGLAIAAFTALAGFALDIRDKVKDLSRDIESVREQVRRLEAKP